MITLGIETSCDETSAAIVRNGKVLSNVVSSSVDLHKRFGGVVPEIASRFHIEYINEVFKKSLKNAKVKMNDINLVAVTDAPGLPGSLITGVSFARALSYALSVPMIAINHLSAHIYSNFLNVDKRRHPQFPFIGVVVSGGHTNIFLCRNINDFKVLGNTQDDAIGEAFDKVAKILDLGYPGGPVIEKMAKKFSFKRDSIKFPKTFLGKDSFDFSFSGIKTAVLYYIKNKRLTNELKSKISYSFQEAVFSVVVEKSVTSCRKHNIKTMVIGGGVAANKRLNEIFKGACKAHEITFFTPPLRLCLDNGAMVAGLGEALYEKGVRL